MEVQVKNFAAHVQANTCAVNLQHVDDYEFVQGYIHFEFLKLIITLLQLHIICRSGYDPSLCH